MTEILETPSKALLCQNLYRIDTLILFLTEHSEVKCWEGEHFSWALGFGIPSLIIWIIILPLVIGFTLKKNRNHLTIAKIADKYAFLYTGYKKEKYYWELIVLIRKVMLIFLMVLPSLGWTLVQIMFSLFIMIISFVLQRIHNPYTEKEFNSLEEASLISINIINFSAIYFHVVKGSKNLDLFVVLVGHLGFTYFAFLFIKALIKTERKNFCKALLRDRITRYLKSKLSFFFRDKTLGDQKKKNWNLLKE